MGTVALLRVSDMHSVSISAVLLGLSISSCVGSPLSLSKINALTQKEEPSSHEEGVANKASQDGLESNMEQFEESVSGKSAHLNADLERLQTSVTKKLGNLEHELALKQREEKMLRDRIKENVQNGGLMYPIHEEWMKGTDFESIKETTDDMPHMLMI